jgi:hypothetical protein
MHVIHVPESKVRTGPSKYIERVKGDNSISAIIEEHSKSPSKASVKFGGSNEMEVFRHPYLKCSCALLFLAE